MVDLIIRQKVSDYGKWRPFFDGNEKLRRSYGATGVKQVYRDAKDPDMVTVIIEWDKAENAQKFTSAPEFAEVRKKAGVVDKPAVETIVAPA
jgi:heme-degrading monooxygenase HmoA